MVTHRSNVQKTQTGHHGGLRRGTAAAALGVVLALSAGAPASHAATGVRRLRSGRDGLAVHRPRRRWLDGLLGPSTTPSPSPSSPSPQPSRLRGTPTSRSRAAPPKPSPAHGRRSLRSPRHPRHPRPRSPPPLARLAPARAGQSPAQRPVGPRRRAPAADSAGRPGAGRRQQPPAVPPSNYRPASPSTAAAASPTATGGPPTASAEPRSGSTSMEATSTRQPAGPSPVAGPGASASWRCPSSPVSWSCGCAASDGAGRLPARQRRIRRPNPHRCEIKHFYAL